jgi:hypothetical protein
MAKTKKNKLSPKTLAKLDTLIKFQYAMEVDNAVEINGNVLASGDDAEDRKAEQRVWEQLRNGNEWAWCVITVKATIPGIAFEGIDVCGACSYESEEQFREHDLADMQLNARYDLIDKVTEFLARLGIKGA